MTAVAAEESIPSSENVEEYKETASKDDENTLQSAFSNKTIRACEYVYNLDDAADYIYVEFEEGGYALFARETMEMMEYSLQGTLPYSDSSIRNYYAGPSNYLQKINAKFIDMKTNKPLDITPEDAIAFSQQVRTHVKNQTTYRADISLEKDDITAEINNFLSSNESMPATSSVRSSDPPDYDGNALIQASLGSGSTLIPNYRYFVINPTHGRNVDGEVYGNGNSGTCGAVAAQLLLGYHNYYSDRRIIEDRFLDGYDDETNTVITPQFNPNYCPDPMEMASFILGTRSEPTGANSFYMEMMTRIMEPGTSGATLEEVKDGIEDFLSERLASTEYLVNYEERGWFFGYSPIDSSIIKGEINKGRPIIITTSKNLDATNHAVVGYGYQNFTYPGDSGTYEGYIVHMGWDEEEACIWINSAWCDGYVSLKINHTHSYNEVGAIPGTNRTEYRCSICGHRTDAAIRVTAETRYTEHVATIPQNEYLYKDYYVTFATPGRKLFLTFGNEDAQLYLFDAEYNQLAFDDDDGLNLNAMLYYTVEANKPYILRAKFYEDNEIGDVKIAVTPASYQCAFYEQLDTMTGTGEFWGFDLPLGKTFVLTFTPSQSGTYAIRTAPFDDIDTVLYVLDAVSTSACLFDDNGSDSQQATITTTLTAGKSYFIVVSAADITTEEGETDFFIQKVS